MAPRSFQQRVLLLVICLLVLVVAGILTAVYLALEAHSREETTADLRVAARVLAAILAARRERLASEATALAADAGFQRAAASGDEALLRAALGNHRERVGADVAIVSGLDRVVVADRPGLSAHDARALCPGPAVPGRPPKGVVVASGGVLLRVTVPLPASRSAAWLCMGSGIDERLAADLQRMTGLEVTLFRSGRPPGRGGVILASTLPEPRRAGLASALAAPSGRALGGGEPSTLAVGGEDYLTLRVPLAHGEGVAGAVGAARVEAVLQRRVGDALASFQRLARRLVLLAAVAAAASLAGALLVARGVSRPVQRLVEGADRIAGGGLGIGTEGGAAADLDRVAVALQHFADRALRDPVSGLASRAAFLDRLDQALALAQRKPVRLAVLLLDLDRFKQINDTLGHAAGDRVLAEVGSRLRGALRESDTVARLGGDEFAVLLPEAGAADGEAVAGKLAEVLRSPVELGALAVEVSASIGVAAFPAHGRDLAAVLQRADAAMYQAKAARAGHAVYAPGHGGTTAERAALAGELRRALEVRQVALHYQPVVDLTSGRPVAAEALARWTHPERGPIAPAEFLGAAEQSGQLRWLTGWSLAEAVRQAAEWVQAGLRLPVAVNLTASDLMDVGLPASIFRPLLRHDLDPALLCLEIRESALLTHARRAADLLRELKELGVTLVVDDFGAGLSSLARLQRLPIHGLKISRGFVLHLLDRPDQEVLVRSGIAIGHTLGLTVTAAGAESPAAIAVLRRLGCDRVQGFAITPALPPAALAAWAAAQPGAAAATAPQG